MSADNYLLIREAFGGFYLTVECASMDVQPIRRNEKRYETLEQATKAAAEYMNDNLVEYGCQFELSK